MLGHSERFCHITEDPGQTGMVCFHKHSIEQIILLIKDCQIATIHNLCHMSMKVLNEIDLHIEEFEQQPSISESLSLIKNHTFNLTEKELLFTTYTLGVKICRKLYRMPENMRHGNTPAILLPMTPKIKTSTLLNYVEKFALRQIKCDKESCVGYMNLGWVNTEKNLIKEASEYYFKAMKLADKVGNDVVSCTSRIEYCGCIIMGEEEVDLVEVTDMYV